MTITEFIESIDNKLYNRIRNSKGDAECRRLLKEHEQKQLSIHVVGVPKGEQLKCECKYATFTRVVTDDYEPQCGKCWKPIQHFY